MTYLFHQEKGFYPLNLPTDKLALGQAILGVDILKVEKLTDKGSIVIWEKDV